MKTPFNRPALMVLGALTLLAAAPAFGQLHEVGHWHGYGQSDTDRRFIIPCVDILTPGQNNRFQATVELDSREIEPCVFPVDCTRSNAGVITGSGIDEHGHRLLIHGKARVMGDGSVRVAAFQYKMFERRGGVMDEGYMALVQMIGGADWDDLAGPHVNSDFQGSYHPDSERAGGDLKATLFNVSVATEGDPRTDSKPTTMIGGSLSFFDVFMVAPPDPVMPGAFDFEFDLGGTVGVPAVQNDGSTIAAFASIGLINPPDPVMPNGIIAILIGQVVHPASSGEIVPCVIPGDYRLCDSFFDVFTEVFHGTDSSFSQGAFLLTEDLGDVP